MKILFVNVEKCLSCRSCEIACAVEHSQSKQLFKAINEEPIPQARVKVEKAGEFSIPLQCRHCEDAPCVTICPTKAIKNLEGGGPVIIDKEKCIGCKWCILVCPFGVIKLSREGKAVIKCDFCLSRLEKNQEPACVEACPTGALQCKLIEEITAEKRKGFIKEFLVVFEKGKRGKEGDDASGQGSGKDYKKV